MKLCPWCGEEIPEAREGDLFTPGRRKRQDTKFCGKRCRQASWRFAIGRAPLEATGGAMLFAYGDPPYPGKAGLYPEKTEVDHRELVRELEDGYPDGWALSTDSPALPEVLSYCPKGVRIGAWVRTVRRVRSARALRCWEPVIVCGGRPLGVDVVQDLRDTLETPEEILEPEAFDALIARGRFRAYPGALVGMKPPAFAEWIFRMLGVRQGDDLGRRRAAPRLVSASHKTRSVSSTPLNRRKAK